MLRRTALAVLAILLLTGRFAAQTTPTTTLTFSPAQYPSDAGARAIVSADFDGDGAPDFATANAGSNTVDVFLNREFSGGGFTVTRYAVGAGPFDIAAYDFNVDGYPDLAVAAADADEIDILFGGVGGSFAAPKRLPAPGNPRGIAVAWIGSDGPGIVYSSYASGTVSILSYDFVTGSFTAGPTLNAGTNPQGIAIGGFKAGGGYPDIAVANASGSRITLLQNFGNFNFTRTELSAPAGSGTNTNVLVAADFDRDGRLDLVAASTVRNTVELYLNGTSGIHWTTNLTGAGLSSPRGMVVTDLNTDGRLDLAVASRASSSVTIFYGSASGSVFTTHQIVKSSSGSRAVTAVDFDGDGRVDLATANEYTTAGTVLWNRTAAGGGSGAAAFELRALPDVTPNGWSQGGPYAVADFNHNGIPDVVVGDGVVLDAKTPVKVDAGRDFPVVSAAVVGDFNEDGHVDFAQTTSYTVSMNPYTTAVVVDCLMGDGAGHFTRGASLTVKNPRGMVAADLNRDGHVDIVVVDEAGSGSMIRRVFLGRGDGTFAETDQPNPLFEILRAAADMNGDGNLDLILWNSGTLQVVVRQGDGAGNFPGEQRGETVNGAYTLEVGDVNGDGRPDVVSMALSSRIITWLGRSDGTLSSPLFSDVPEFAGELAVADFTGDGRLDILTSEGTLAVGKGDGTFAPNRAVNISFHSSIAADVDRDGRPDLLIGTDNYTAMVLYNRTVEQPNAAPIARLWPHDNLIGIPFAAQFGEEGFSISARKSYDPNLDPLSFTWMDGDRVVGTRDELLLNMPPGTHVLTLVVRDNAGAESRDSVTITIAPYDEIMIHTLTYGTHGTWAQADDVTAADRGLMYEPNADRAKLAAPLANPANYIELFFPADPNQEYKLWIRMKAQGNSPYNDSVFVQFSNAVDQNGAPAFPVGTTSGLAVNLEECSGCGLNGWGWRDEAWGSKGVIGTVTLRFPAGTGGSLWHSVRIQSREDGAMIDQVVLSAKQYKTTRPGAVKNDTTILPMTVPRD